MCVCGQGVWGGLRPRDSPHPHAKVAGPTFLMLYFSLTSSLEIKMCCPGGNKAAGPKNIQGPRLIVSCDRGNLEIPQSPGWKWFQRSKTHRQRSFCCGSVVMNPTSNHEDMGSIPSLAQWIKDPVLP